MAKQGHIFVTNAAGFTCLLSDQDPHFKSDDAPFPNAVQSWGPNGREKDRPIDKAGVYESAQMSGAVAIVGPYAFTMPDGTVTQRSIVVLPE